MTDELRIELSRGGLPESAHAVTAAVFRDGHIVARACDPARRAFLRSSAKPFQALACVVTGAADRFAMTGAELALACGSHGGEPFHTATSGGLLRRIGLSPDALLCGVHTPSYEPAARALAAAGQEPGTLHNNCSGKHAAMLAACVAAGWSTHDYVAPEHPLQRMILGHLAAFAGVAVSDLPFAVDGCSVPTFHLSVAAAATAFGHWANPEDFPELPADARAAAARIALALARHPEMIGGTKRVDTDVIAATGGRVICKVGAEGMWCAGVRGEGLGVAVQCADGASRAAYAAGMALLRHLRVLDDAEWDALSSHHDPVRRNHRGLDVGRVRVRIPDGFAA